MTVTVSYRHVIAAAVLVALVCAFGFMALRSYVDGRTQQATYAQLKADNERYFKELDAKNDERWKGVLVEQKQIAADKQNVQTPEQVAQLFRKYFPTLPVEVHVEQPTGSDGKPLPDAPSQLVIPHQDIKPLFDFGADCRSCTVERLALQGQVTDLNETIKRKDAQIKKSEDAAKGGGFFTRVRRGAKHIACSSAATSAGFVTGRKTRPEIGATVGVGTLVACELL